VVEGKSSPADVGGVREVTYKDGTVQKIKLTERSDARCELSWDLIESNPPVHAMSSSWTLKLTEVRSPAGSVFVEWTADFSRDAGNDVLADGKYKAKEHFKAIATATKKRIVKVANAGPTIPKIKRQLSSRSRALWQAFKKLDTNKNGKLEFNEFAVVVNRFMGEDKPLPDAAVRIILMTADLNNDGTIDFDEFCKFLGKDDMPSGDAKANEDKPQPSTAATTSATASAKK